MYYNKCLKYKLKYLNKISNLYGGVVTIDITPENIFKIIVELIITINSNISSIDDYIFILRNNSYTIQILKIRHI